MDVELRLFRVITLNLPKIKGAGSLARMVRRVYLRKSRNQIETEVLGNTMCLDPYEWVDGDLLFCPHLCDFKEIAFLKRVLKPGGTFLDIGANIGFYSLIASRLVGKNGCVLSIEADPFNYKKLKHNISLNKGMNNIVPLQVGVSDKKETIRMGIYTLGNRGGNSFLRNDFPESINVDCESLHNILCRNQVDTIDIAKIDIEGFEYRVLEQFFNEAAVSLFPKYLIVEVHPYFFDQGDILRLLRTQGYMILGSNRLNYMLERQG